jgi:hypothetical protein
MNQMPPHSKISYPIVSNKDFKWSSGSDVQAIWRKYGWTPPSEKMNPPPPERYVEPTVLRRFK